MIGKEILNYLLNKFRGNNGLQVNLYQVFWNDIK